MATGSASAKPAFEMEGSCVGLTSPEHAESDARFDPRSLFHYSDQDMSSQSQTQSLPMHGCHGEMHHPRSSNCLQQNIVASDAFPLHELHHGYSTHGDLMGERPRRNLYFADAMPHLVARRHTVASRSTNGSSKYENIENVPQFAPQMPDPRATNPVNRIHCIS